MGAKTFYVLQSEYNYPSYLCEWEVQNDVPVHVRHILLTPSSNLSIELRTTWITPTHVYVTGYKTGVNSASYKVLRSNLTLVSEPVATDAQVGGGNDGGYTNHADGYALMWDPYDAATGGVHLAKKTEALWPASDGPNYAVSPSFTTNGTYHGDLSDDGLTTVWSAYNDPNVKKATGQGAPTTLFNWLTNYTETPLFNHDFEGGSVQGWSLKSGGTSLTNEAVTGGGGSRVLSVVRPSFGTVFIQSPLYSLVDKRARFRNAITLNRQGGGLMTVVMSVDWHDSGGNFISNTGSSSDVVGSEWETTTLALTPTAPVNAASFRIVMSFDADAYVDRIKVYPEHPNPRTQNEPLKVKGNSIFVVVSTIGSFYPGMFTGYTAFHRWGLVELDLATGTLISWTPIDPPGALDGGTFSPSGLAITEDGLHVVAAKEGSASITYPGVVWCKNLSTGAQGSALSPHLGDPGTGLDYTGLTHVGAYRTRGTPYVLPRIGALGVT